MDLLADLGMVKGQIGDGHWDVTCPFVDEHTGGDTGAAYLSGGGFKCHHGHCQGRTTPAFIAKLDALARVEGVATVAAREFQGVDQPALLALRARLEAGQRPTRAEYDVLANIAPDDVAHELRRGALFCDTDTKPIHDALARARNRCWRTRRKAKPAQPLPLPAGYQAPVSLGRSPARHGGGAIRVRQAGR